MGTSFAPLHTVCPLCGSPVLTFSRQGRVTDDEMHAVRLGGQSGHGYSLCDDCGLLADLRTNLTLN